MHSRALFSRRPADPPTIDIAFDGAVYPVRLRRHPQARRYTLRIQARTGEVVLTMPSRGRLAEARAFAERNSGWIAARLKRLPRAAPFIDGAVIPLRGYAHRIVHRGHVRGTVWIEIEREERLLCVAGAPPHVGRRIADHLKREAKRELEAACRRYAQELRVAVKRVSVRDQSSRWGSCSTTGALSFSWRLILAPDYVLDYLAAHEVTHLVEMNHSRRFWRVLRAVCPHIERAKAWLDAHGADLHRYGINPAATASGRVFSAQGATAARS